MNEFIEKLIGRLEEEAFDCTVAKDYVPQVVELDCIKAIVKELAEEYKHCALCYLQSPCEYQNENAQMPMEYWEKGWIPCSERLPEEDVEVLVCIKDCEGNYFYDLTYFHIVWQTEIGGMYSSVIAWQPLPKPYNPKGE